LLRSIQFSIQLIHLRLSLRFQCVINVTGAGTHVIYIYPTPTNASVALDANKGMIVNYAGFETGSVATSPIITAGSTVTRLKDENIVAIPTMTTGSVFAEIQINNFTMYQPIIYIDDGSQSYTSRIDIGCTSGVFRVGVDVGGAPQSDTTLGNFLVGKNKIAVTFTNGTLKAFLNGALIFTNTPAQIPTLNTVRFMSRMDISSNSLGSEMIIYNTILSDAEAIALTTI